MHSKAQNHKRTSLKWLLWGRCRFRFLGKHSRMIFFLWNKASNATYRKAILKAIEDLHDCHLRSNVDSIRRHAYAALEGDNKWNEVIFMTTLKAIVNDGEVEQSAGVNCALSPEYKRRRANSLTAYIETKKESQPIPFIPESSSFTPVAQQQQPGCEFAKVKSSPKRKAEHDKYKIMPKSLCDQTL